MTNAFVTEVKALLAKFEANTEVQTIETDVKAIGVSALNFIKTNGLTDLYNIALSVLAGAATGTPWASIGATVVSQGETAGITIAKGAESIVIAQAQADLIAQGTLAAPTTGEVVTPAPAPSGAATSGSAA